MPQPHIVDRQDSNDIKQLVVVTNTCLFSSGDWR
jgi:hypothetical protein